MVQDPPAGRPWWRDALQLIAELEAAAVALWLIPASIHIVSWPAAGPVRLALLAPTRRAVWWLVAAALGAAVLATITRTEPGQGGDTTRAGPQTSGSVASTLRPLLLLWLWAIPYLPWLPDRIPLLLVLAGPLRWVLAAIAVGVVVARLVRRSRPGSDQRQAPHWLPGRRTVFAISVSIYVAAGLYSVRVNGLGGDEPHYLIITESLLRDHDLKIENNHLRGDYRSFFSGDLRPDYMQRGKDGQIYSIHAPGLPALVLPVYAAVGYRGVVASIGVMAAAAALAIFDLAALVAGPVAALWTWIAVCLTVPFIPHSWLIFPEMPGALLVAWAALWLASTADVSAFRWWWRGMALSLLPWLHTKFAVFLALFAAALSVRILARRTGVRAAFAPLAAFLAPLAVSGALWLYSFYALYGVLDPEAPYGAYTRIYVLTRNIPHGLIGLFFDQKFGLLFYSPIYLVAIAGAWMMLRDRQQWWLASVLVIVAGVFTATTARLYMFWGGSSAPARFLVPVLPCLAPMMAVAFARLRGAAARGLTSLWLGVSVAFAAMGAAWPGGHVLFSDPHGRARLLEMFQGGSPLALVLPTFTDPDWADQLGGLWIWIAAGTAAVGAAVLASRALRARASLAALAASMGVLGTAAALTATPSAAVREATARRGAVEALWQFDGTRQRTFDYARWRRATPERLRDLRSIAVGVHESEAGYASDAVALPPGTYDVLVWFKASAAREGEIAITELPNATLARTSGLLSNPTPIRLELPVPVSRLAVRIPNKTIGAAIANVRIVPVAVAPPGERPAIHVRAIEAIRGRDGAYLIYTDEHAYPEGGVFWTRGTADTHIYVAPAGASRLTLTLSTGPQGGDVRLSTPDGEQTLPMTANQGRQLTLDIPAGRTLVPLTIGSSVMFRPGDIDPSSRDMRGLGCRVDITLD